MIARSSAYANFLETVVGKSEMQMLKRKGASRVPCGKPLIILQYMNSLITTVCFWHCISQQISQMLFLLQKCYLSKIIVKSRQWPTPRESIAIYWVKEIVSCVINRRYCAKEDIQTNRKTTVAKIKIQDFKLGPIRTPPLNTAAKLLNKPELQPAIQHTDWQTFLRIFAWFLSQTITWFTTDRNRQWKKPKKTTLGKFRR